MTDIKICGVRTPDDVRAVRTAGASHIGFNAVARSKRFAPPDTVAGLGAAAEGLRRVALFVDAEDAEMAPYLPAVDIIQLHGGESPERAADVSAKTGKRVWKVIGVGSASDLDEAARYREVCDLILFDSKPGAGEIEGGRGVRLDWSLLTARRFPFRWGLAGGLRPDNVARAIAATGAPLVDVASGVEEPPGEKNGALIRRFCEAVRTA